MLEKQRDLQVGNIVHLKSGSPDLKIVAIQNDSVVVEWGTDLGNPQRATFPAVCIHSVSPLDRSSAQDR